MSEKSISSLSELVQKHKNETHHLRIKLAPEMFHAYCRNMSEIEAKNLTCELLRISANSFDYAIQKDPLAKLYDLERNNRILDMRCDGFSFDAIRKSVGLSRVQVWRIIKSFEEKMDKIKFLENKKIKDTRLKYPELDKIEALRQKLKALKPAENRQIVWENVKSEKSEKNIRLKSIGCVLDRAGRTWRGTEKTADFCDYLN